MQHSASSISLANRCDRAWWHCYRDKLRPPELPWLKAKRMKARGASMPAGAFGKALGTETHRLAEIYLTVSPARVARKRLIDWNDLPGQCLAELVSHLPPAGSVPRSQVEARFSLKVDGVSFRGLIDVLVSSSWSEEVWDHKTTRDIRAYALLPDAVARATNQPKRSLRDDLQACLYVLAKAKAPGGLARWNYTETQRTRRSLPVVQFIPTDHARTVAARAADVARRVEAFETIEDAVPNTTACDQYGGCWYRSEGHCRVPRKLGSLFIHAEKEAKEKAAMKTLKLKDLNKATAKANAEEERKAALAKKAKAAPPPEADDTDEDDSEDEEDDAPESEPAPAKFSAGKKAKSVRRKLVASHDAGEDSTDSDEDDSGADEDEAPPSEPKAKRKSAPPAPRPVLSERERIASATAAPDHILQFFGAVGRKGEAKIVATAFAELAEHLSNNLPRNPERGQCLRKLLEASDCATRAIEGEA